MEAIQISIQIYFMAFCVAMIIAAIIKGLLMMIHFFTLRKEAAQEGK